jgi:signal transduction histidine kinase
VPPAARENQGATANHTLHVGLVGAGRGGTFLLQLFAGAPTVRVVAVADPNPEAPGLALARAWGIPVIRSHLEIFAYAPRIVVEVTGLPGVLAELARAKPTDVELVGAQSARLFGDLVMRRAHEAQKLEKAETIRRMTGGVFHSLNNFFTAILGRATLLLRALDRGQWTPAQLTEGLQVIARNVTRASEILNRLRVLTRESAEQPVTRVDVNGLVREGIALTDPLIRETLLRSATIEVREEPGEIPLVVGRSSELLEVLVNLIVNAIEAMPEGGTLTLASSHQGATVLIRVQDTGLGVPDAVKAQLFTPFFTTKAHGTGLGLSVSQEILRRHGGDLEVESVEGKGTCFTVKLPAVVGLEEGTSLPGLMSRRALIVDDDPFFRDILAKLLTAEGYQVSSAAGGAEAVACLEREPYNLVITDIVMPNITGWQVATTARARNPEAVVIVFSGWGNQSEDPSFQDIGADAFLPKPFQLPELVQTVRGVLARRTQP